MEHKFCVDCVYNLTMKQARDAPIPVLIPRSESWECNRPELTTYDPVIGPTYKKCRDMRNDDNACGSTGRFYKPRSFFSRLF